MCPLAAVMDNISEQMSFYSPKGQINKNNKTIRRVRSRCHRVCICSVNHLPPVKTLISLISGAPALTHQCLCAETEAEDIMRRPEYEYSYCHMDVMYVRNIYRHISP